MTRGRDDAASNSAIRAGFESLPQRGKGSHSVWKHATYPDIPVVTLADHLGDDAQPYQERDGQNV